jgi:hypothetical protein
VRRLSGDCLGEPEEVDEAAESRLAFRLKSDEMRRAVFGADNIVATLAQQQLGNTELMTTPGVNQGRPQQKMRDSGGWSRW